MGLDLKNLQMGFLFFFFCGWVALAQGGGAPGPCVRIGTCTILDTAKHSMKDSHIIEELAEAATKNQGSNKAIKGIKGLKVTDMRPPNITLSYVENTGMRMVVTSQLTIAGKSFIGGSMEITVASNMTTVSRMTVEKHTLSMAVTSCGVNLISCKTNLPSSMLPKIVNKFLNSTLGKVLPGMMCPAADKVVAEMKKKMESLWEPQEIADRGTVTYYLSGNPKITTDHARVCFETQITRTTGEEIEIPSDPPASSNLPELEKENSELTFPVNTLDAWMDLNKPELEQDVTSDTVEGRIVISVAELKERAPTMDFPASYSDLKIKIRVASPPTWSLGEGVASLIIPLTLEAVAVPQGESVFLLTVDLTFPATFKVIDGKLQPSLETPSLENLQVTSTSVGPFDPELLRSYLLDLIHVTIRRTLEKIMDDGMPLPSMMDSGYGDATPNILPNLLQVIVTSSCD